MSKGIFAALLAPLCFGVTSSAQAWDNFEPGSLQLVVDSGLAFGGDTIATATYTDGSTKTLHAGDGLFTDVGGQYNFADTDWSLKAAAGVKYNGLAATNGTISFTRYPIDLLAIYSSGSSHFSAGLTYELDPKVDLDGFGPNGKFNNATGLVLEYQYWLFGARYTNIKYHISGICTAGCSFNGSSLGLYVNFAFF